MDINYSGILTYTEAIEMNIDDLTIAQIKKIKETKILWLDDHYVGNASLPKDAPLIDRVKFCKNRLDNRAIPVAETVIFNELINAIVYLMERNNIMMP
jgi:hypothetical protein